MAQTFITPDPDLRLFSALPSAPVAYRQYAYRFVSSTSWPGAVTWPQGGPSVAAGNMGVAVLIFNGQSWTGRWMDWGAAGSATTTTTTTVSGSATTTTTTAAATTTTTTTTNPPTDTTTWYTSGAMSVSGAGVAPGAADGGLAWRGRTAASAFTFTLNAEASATNGNVIPCLIYRFVDVNNYAYASWQTGTNPTLYTVSSGTHTQVPVSGGTPTITSDSTAMRAFRVDVNSNTITLYNADGSVAGNATVTNYASATQAGIRKGGNGTVTQTPWTLVMS